MANVNGLRDWWEGISPREQSLVVILGATLVVAALVWVGVRINDGLATIEEKNADTRFALEVLYEYRLNQGQANQQPQVPIPDEPVKLETYLSNIADEVSVTIPQFDRRSPVTKGGFVETSTRVELRKVSIGELTQFLEQVESKNRVVVVKYLRVRRVLRDKEKLNVQMDISTYSKVVTEGDEDAQEREG